jgi:hypothetical protein
MYRIAVGAQETRMKAVHLQWMARMLSEWRGWREKPPTQNIVYNRYKLHTIF